MGCTVTQLARGSYVREFELSHSKLVNRIIKITHTQFAREDVGLSPFYNSYVKKRQIVYYKIFSSDFKKSPRLNYNICN